MFSSAIFDWDGTLADTRKPILISFQKALSEINCSVSDQYIERRIGIGASETFREILRSKNMPINEELIDRLVQRKSQIQIAHADEVQLFEGAVELLENLQGKIKVSLASMNNNKVVGHLLKKFCLESYFQVVFTGDRVSRSKPDPEIFLRTAQELTVEPEKCVVFEDSIFGVKAAKNAGMSCVAVTTGVYNKQELKQENPDVIVESLKDPKILQYILNQ